MTESDTCHQYQISDAGLGKSAILIRVATQPPEPPAAIRHREEAQDVVETKRELNYMKFGIAL
jgi:hypothetical protein